MSDFLLWLHQGRVKAKKVDSLPSLIFHDDIAYDLTDEYLGDADYLRNSKGELVGFAFITSGDEVLLQSRLVTGSQNVRRDGAMLMFILNENDPFEIECVQAIGSRIYANAESDFIVGIPGSDAGKLGFKLCNTNAPICADSD
jgi:hypothetical protein